MGGAEQEEEQTEQNRTEFSPKSMKTYLLHICVNDNNSNKNSIHKKKEKENSNNNW